MMSEKRFLNEQQSVSFEDLPLTIQERCIRNKLGYQYIDFLLELIEGKEYIDIDGEIIKVKE